MTQDIKLTQIESENCWVFGLKWSVVGIVMAFCLLAGCSFFDAKAPRYNTVQGERRMPVLNQTLRSQEELNEEAALQHGVMGEVSPVVPYSQPDPAPQATVEYAPQEMMPAPEQHAAMQQMPPQAPLPAPSYEQPAPPAQAYAPAAPAGDYPVLPPTNAAPAVPASLNDSEIRAEIDALERDLMSAQSQQQSVRAQAQSEDDSWLPDLGLLGGDEQPAPAAPNAAMNAPMETMPQPAMAVASAPVPVNTAIPSDPALLPPPPAGPMAYGEAPAAPVIDPAMASAHQQQAMSMAPQVMEPSSMEVPVAPDVQGTTYMPMPGGLTPPDLSSEYGAGYLPPSRYQRRR